MAEDCVPVQLCMVDSVSGGGVGVIRGSGGVDSGDAGGGAEVLVFMVGVVTAVVVEMVVVEYLPKKVSNGVKIKVEGASLVDQC